MADSSSSALSGHMTVDDVLYALNISQRVGAEKDTPEGSRYIMISDTLTKRMIDGLKAEAEKLKRIALLEDENKDLKEIIEAVPSCTYCGSVTCPGCQM